ncbi:hypothetical protein [Noviherbaspirillum malthae]|uniref:hypothetical protein n=1 Tax=Noviherbaspirillum malthae TaxID=1260987 RepID=UPI00188ED61A|nr:hypothetical protein [Noviherbaspirillum malthae]
MLLQRHTRTVVASHYLLAFRRRRQFERLLVGASGNSVGMARMSATSPSRLA